jgi:PIN domain nuclease of toxin-antitoxin system
MTLLLDTHAFLWFWWSDPQLSAKPWSSSAGASFGPTSR